MTNCAVCESVIFLDEHVAKCHECGAFICEACAGIGLELCAPCTSKIADQLSNALRPLAVMETEAEVKR